MRPNGNGRPNSGDHAQIKDAKLGSLAGAELHRRGSGGSAAAPQKGTLGIVGQFPLGRQGAGRHGQVKDRDKTV